MKKTDLIGEICSAFKTEFNISPEIISSAPGRINFIGEHTDYNNGLAIPFAINRWVSSAITYSKSNSFFIYSLNYQKSMKIDLDEKIMSNDQWVKIVSQIILTIKSKFNITRGANIVVAGNIPIGCGLSSSAAFIVSIVGGLLKLFKIQISNEKLAILCRDIEESALGIACGLLDQYSVILSKVDYAMMIDFKYKSFEYFPITFKKTSILVVNSKVNRELSRSGYIDRVRESRIGLEILKNKFKINDFREINASMIEILKKKKVLYKRMKHIFEENLRVKEMRIKLENGTELEIGKILKNCHESLRTLYEVSCEEIDYIIDISESFSGCYGGRIVGGGFGGCSIHLVDKSLSKQYKEYINKLFNKKFDYELDFYEVEFSDGFTIES